MSVDIDKSSEGTDGEAENNSNFAQPRVFISYSWTSQEHQERVKGWADRLVADGVDVIFDLYDLREGSDKYAYMERMVTDPSVTHVLVFSDREYARKADGRSAGVGVESQIISENVYNKVEQSKFIPIICERDEGGKTALPVFMKSLVWIDFSTEQAVNMSWEQLIRLLYGRPRHVKPRLGTRPRYLDDAVDENTEVLRGRFSSLKTAMVAQRGDVALQRADFLDACFAYADELRIRQPPDEDNFGTKVMEDCRKLMAARDSIIDWVSLESGYMESEELASVLIEVLERLLVLKFRPPDMTSWNPDWFGAQSVFVYETFLYVVAALLRANKHEVLHDLFGTHYVNPETERYGDQDFVRFNAFHGDSTALNQALTTEGGTGFLSPAAELIKRQATRNDIQFSAIMESELLVFLATLVDGNLWWFPNTLLYAKHGQVPPFFLRAARHADFVKLSRVLGIKEVGEVRRVVSDNWQNYKKYFTQPIMFRFPNNLLAMLNMEKLDTLP